MPVFYHQAVQYLKKRFSRFGLVQYNQFLMIEIVRNNILPDALNSKIISKGPSRHFLYENRIDQKFLHHRPHRSW